MTVALLVMTDGRDEYLDQTMWSALERVNGETEWWIHDDGGTPGYRAALRSRYPTFNHINGGYCRQGFGGAIRSAWEQLDRASAAEHIFHVEGDFVFNRPVDVWQMVQVLDANPHLVQMALRRQPWNDAERAAGGVVEQNPGAYAEWADGAGRQWLEHRLFWTTNPCLYRRSLLAGGWPDGARSEGHYTSWLLQHGSPETTPPLLRFGYWGHRADLPWVEHIGVERTGNGY